MQFQESASSPSECWIPETHASVMSRSGNSHGYGEWAWPISQAITYRYRSLSVNGRHLFTTSFPFSRPHCLVHHKIELISSISRVMLDCGLKFGFYLCQTEVLSQVVSWIDSYAQLSLITDFKLSRDSHSSLILEVTTGHDHRRGYFSIVRQRPARKERR